MSIKPRVFKLHILTLDSMLRDLSNLKPNSRQTGISYLYESSLSSVSSQSKRRSMYTFWQRKVKKLKSEKKIHSPSRAF